MDESSLEMLEFPKIREILADFTTFSASRELAISLEPSSDPNLISQLLKQSSEARRLLSLRPEFSVGVVHDVREVVNMAARGKMLEPKMLIYIQDTLAASRIVRNNLIKLQEELPVLWSIVQQIVEQPKLGMIDPVPN